MFIFRLAKTHVGQFNETVPKVCVQLFVLCIAIKIQKVVKLIMNVRTSLFVTVNFDDIFSD